MGGEHDYFVTNGEMEEQNLLERKKNKIENVYLENNLVEVEMNIIATLNWDRKIYENLLNS